MEYEFTTTHMINNTYNLYVENTNKKCIFSYLKLPIEE